MQSSGTHREVAADRPDIIVKNKKEKTCILIDVAVPADRNATKKGSRKEKKVQEYMYKTNVGH
jgi:uncharacterized protein YaeQ